MASNKDNLILGAHLGTELGAPGTWISGGFITHEEYNQKLVWRRGIDIFDKMRKSDATIQAMLKICKHPLLAATWDIEPASDEEFDQYVARFLRDELFNRNVNWWHFLRDALGKLDFGFSVFEKTYGMTEFEGQTRIGLANLGWRKQWSVLRWETQDGNPGITQQLIGASIDIPQEKLLVFVNDREGDNYQGVSLLRYVYKAWDIKHRIENFMAVAAERSLGVPIVEKSPDMSKKDEEKMREVMRNFRANQQQYLEFPMGQVKIDWMKIETNIKTDLIPMLEYLQHEIDKSILAQFIDLAGSVSGGSGGSRALSEDHSQLFEKALEAVGNEVVTVMNGDLIQQLCDLNFSEMPNGYPKLTFTNLGDRNLAEIGTFLNSLALVDLITPDPDLENILRQWGDLPDLPDDIYDNYDERTTAKSMAQPLVPGGPGQDPNALPPSGQPLANPTSKIPAPKNNEPGNKLPGDQSNATTRVNQTKRRANKPTPESSSWPLSPRPNVPKLSATEELTSYRNDLITRVMADESD